MFKKLLSILACGVLLFPAKAAFTTPTASTSNAVYYYTLHTPLRYTDGPLYLTSQGIEHILKGETAISDESYWLFQDRGDGTYNLISYSNGLCVYADPTSAPGENDPVYTSLTVPSAGWRLADANGDDNCVIYSGTSVQFNQTGNRGQTWDHDGQIFNWGMNGGNPNTGDDGAQYRLTQVGSASGQCAVKFNESTNGSFTVKKDGVAINSGDAASFGSTISVDVEPAAGYFLNQIRVNGVVLPHGVTSFQVNKDVTVEVTFDNTLHYDVPGGVADNSYYASRIYTENAKTDIDQSWDNGTDAVCDLVNQEITIAQGTSFNLHLVAAENEQLKWTSAIIFTDWNRDTDFEELVQIGKGKDDSGFSNTIGNTDVLNINQTIDVPAEASIGQCLIRVIYYQVWSCAELLAHHPRDPYTQELANSRAYDIVVNVVLNDPSGIENNVNETALYYYNGSIYTNLKGEIMVYDLSGKLVRRADTAPVVVDDLANGAYIVKVAGETLRFVK